MVQLINGHHVRDISKEELQAIFYLTPREKQILEGAENIKLHMYIKDGICDLQIEFITPASK